MSIVSTVGWWQRRRNIFISFLPRHKRCRRTPSSMAARAGWSGRRRRTQAGPGTWPDRCHPRMVVREPLDWCLPPGVGQGEGEGRQLWGYPQSEVINLKVNTHGCGCYTRASSSHLWDSFPGNLQPMRPTSRVITVALKKQIYGRSLN